MAEITQPQCKICTSEHRHEIENMLINEGRSYNEICETMQDKGLVLNLANISVHKNKHMMLNVDTLRTLSKSRTSLMPVIDIKSLSPEDILDYVAQEAVEGIQALKLLPVSHYTLGARNNFLSTIRQIAEAKLKTQGGADKDDITQLINQQLTERGLMIDVTPKSKDKLV